MTTMAEPEWDDHTRALALAADEVEICPICGRPATVCHSSKLQDDWVSDPPVRCHATTALREHQKTFTEDSNPHLDALLFSVRLREGAVIDG